MSGNIQVYSLEVFHKTFRKSNFDELLLEQNNHLVNSNKHYLQLKSTYLDETNKNYNELEEKLEKFSELKNNYTRTHNVSVTTHHYKVINKDLLELANQHIKEILDRQKKLHSVLMNYINFINDACNSEPTTKSALHGVIKKVKK